MGSIITTLPMLQTVGGQGHATPPESVCRIPTVSAIVPCWNEQHYIEASVNSILAQDYSTSDFEVIVVDGMSEDGTRDNVAKIARDIPNLRIIDNPSRTTPCAMNRGIEAARGRYVAILGAHTEYAPDYLRICVELLDEHPEVCCVGGPIVSKGVGLFGRAVAWVMAHPVGVGNAKHRYPNYEGYAEGACYPMFRKEVFKKIGLYDEHLVRNQDDELNYRLARYGEKVFISPRARCTYSVRETPSGLFRQYFQYGFWRVAVLRKHRLPASIRQVVPPLFMSFILAVAILGLLLPGWWRLTAGVLPLLYGSILLVVGASEVGKAGWRLACLFPVAAAIMHAAYAAGFASGLLNGTDRWPKRCPATKESAMQQDYNPATFFNGFAETFDSIYDQKRNLFMRWVDRTFRSDMFVRYALTFEALDQLRGRTVLDIGCGSGPYVVEAVKRGAYCVTGIDPAPNMLALVRERLEQNGLSKNRCELLEGRFPGIAVQPHDCAIVMGVMDYVLDPQTFMTALKPLVKQLAVLSFPSQHWFRTPFRRMRYRLRRCPVYFYDEASIKSLCSVAGFNHVEVKKIPGAGMDFHVCLRP